MKIKDVLTDMKTWVVLVVFFFAIIGNAFGWFKLPQKVEKVEKETEKTKEKIVETAHELDLFIMEQRTIQKDQNRREELMLELIRQKETPKVIPLKIPARKDNYNIGD